jgi:purine-nucleoside phosphorylase
METLYEKIVVAQNYLINNLEHIPDIAIILGTGLGKLVDDLENAVHIPYRNIPHFPVSTVPSHAGELVTGLLDGREVILLSGRVHYYEGYSTEEISFPIRLLKLLGVKSLIVTNSAGGVDPEYDTGDIVAVYDHINLLPDHPLRGPNDDQFGPRFPDMLHAYNKKLLEITENACLKLNMPFKKGVYVAMQGPSLETPAEYKFVKIIGGDLVGMSTVPEVIVAHYCGIEVLVLSTVSNVCFPVSRLTETTLEDVVRAAEEATPRLTALVKEILMNI